MINIKEVLATFSEEKQQHFVLYLSKKNKRKDTKNIQLVKLLIEENFSSKEICLQLYKKDNKTALHALRKRLFQSIIDFTAEFSFKDENSIDIQLIKLILSARTFLQKKLYEVAYKVLDKAELIAKEQQLFTILNEIYHTKIEFSHYVPKLKIDDLIADFKENQKQHQLEEELNIAYSKIRKYVYEINHKTKKTDIKEIIELILKEHDISNLEALSFKSLYQLIQITSISSSQKFDYWNIEAFLINTYHLIENHTSKNKNTFYHIEILYLIANTLFRNKKFTNSLEYLEKMHVYMQENSQKYYKEFTLKHHLLVALNQNYNGNQKKAIQLLVPFLNKKNNDIISTLDISLSLIVFYSQNNQLKNAQNIFSKFYHTDKYYIEKAGIEWTIKKNLIEILLQIDLGNIDIVDSRILSFKRNYTNYLKSVNQQKVITYLKLVEMYYKNPEIITTREFNEKVEASFEWFGREREDIFMMSFFAWLKAKMTKQDIYLVTLDLVKS